METNQKKPNKRQNAGPISKLLFLWMFPLLRKGNRKDLEIEDLNEVPETNASERLTKRLQTTWDDEYAKSTKKGGRPSLFRAFARAFGVRYFMWVGVFCFDAWIIRVGQAMCLKLYIRSFNDPEVTIGWMCFYAAGVCICTLLHILLNHPTAFQMCISGMKCRVGVSSLIYRKALRLSKASQGKSSIGQIVNLLSNDVSRFDYNLHYIAYIFVGPVQLIIFFCILWQEIGWAAVAGVGYVVLLSPSQLLVGKLSAVFRMQIAKQTDERSRIMNEIIMAMRLIKCYAWEKPFAKVINNIRLNEIRALMRRSYLRASFMGVFTANFTFVPFLAVIVYGLIGYHVTPDKAFFAVAIFNVMTEIMMYYVPNAAASIGELFISIHRMEDFLLLEEQGINRYLNIKQSTESRITPRIHMENVSASWQEGTTTLKNLTFDVSGDKVVMVIGPVGGGKTSLLQSLIAELPFIGGICDLEGRVSYASQEPWLFPGSVRENVLFGRPFISEKYARVVHVCALEDDLKQFPYGDMQMIGERGMSLSGGQKARINLARSLYQDADIYLLDDPLSAVDSAVSRHIFELCVKKHLKGHLRILCTHQLQYLPHADHVIVLIDGKITAQGTYDDLLERGVDFVHLLAKETDKADKKKEAEREAEEAEKPAKKDIKYEETVDCDKPDAKNENMAEGRVTAKTYWGYFKQGDSVLGISFLATAFLLTQVLISLTDYWLSLWTTSEESRVLTLVEQHKDLYSEIEEPDVSFVPHSDNGTYSDSSNNTFFDYHLDMETFRSFMTSRYVVENEHEYQWRKHIYMMSYITLAVLVIVIDLIRTVYMFYYTMRISRNIHRRMFSCIVEAPIKFFDDNPSGRIMNRFTKDIGNLDEYLPLSMFDTLDIGLRILGTVIIVCVSNAYFIVPAIILLLAYWYIRNFFVTCSRGIKRIETITRSPLYTHLSSSVQGLSTIRSSKSQKLLIDQFDTMQDIHSSSWYHFIAGNNWFSIWLEMTSVVFLLIVAFSFVAVSSYTTSGKVGLSIASLLQLMNILQFGMRQSAEMENYMTSVERALEYTKIAPQKDTVKETRRGNPSKSWPATGKIKFRDVCLNYDEDKTVLNELDFIIEGREKIGIVGRTGAGKSSIIAALFRLTEPDGDILIDGYDTGAVKLHDLRKNISIIPQDPVLFSGTVRYNLDPFDMFSDEDLWRVLEVVELKDSVPALDFLVAESGANFSIGQRQLVCLARAILKSNKILVMDEATANVDPRTDQLIQNTIRTKFPDCTVITIAHRLQTVMNYDKIMVLDHGNLLEYDHPHKLLQNPDGRLTNLINHTGAANQKYLREIALEAYNEKFGVKKESKKDS
ncbi:Multidrug resistance-associated protein 4 [Orchesella cincta]|uniref:Multidrug resistance-associated protein 4 n=1 Tax=Orchesella cincta TaxID=48709 RepID=A0A1D2NAV7_ORCCI|nr:Multidrug resistance-associated protein 4 [Orchesella cincta]